MMATASNEKNSPRGRQLRRPSEARGTTSPVGGSPPGIAYQERFVTTTSSSSSTSFDSFPSKDVSTVVALSGSLAEDDAQVDNRGESGGAAKRPAWSKPSNGATAEAGAVMGAESWPALSESARASPKSSATHSPKAPSHGSITISEEMAIGSLSSPKKVNTTISTTPSTSNHVTTTRQRSMKRGGSGVNQSNMPANGSSSQSSPAPGAVVEAPPPKTGKSGGSVGESSRESTQRDAGPKGGSFGGNEQQQPRSSYRRSNSGPLTRGDGSYHHGHGGRRDQERGKQDWGNPHRNFGTRDSHAPQPRVGSRPFLRGAAPNAPFIPPPPPPVAVRPFVGPMVYTEVPTGVYYVPGHHPESFRSMPMVPIPSMYLPMPDPNLASKIVNQIEYYFSNENLVKDTYLRQNMDSEGWVSIRLIAGFKKVMLLTDNIQIILDAIQVSNVVEVQGDKLRRRGDWIKWIMPPVQTTIGSPRSIQKSSQNILAAHLNNVTLNEKAAT